MAVFSWGIARPIVEAGALGDEPRNKRDDPRLSDWGKSLPKRSAEAAKLVRRFSCHTIARPAVFPSPLALRRQERFPC
jgi:hypothetical protein